MQCQPGTLEMEEGESSQCFVKLREKVKELKKTLKVPERENVEERQPQIIATASSSKSVEEQRKLIQKQAMVLQHAQKCTSTYNNNKCEQLHCETMKHLLNHMKTCIEDINCSVPLCSSSRQILIHWKTCINKICPLCTPTHSSAGVLGSQTSAVLPDSDIINLCDSLYNPQAEFLMQDNPFPFNSFSSLPPSPPGAVETLSSFTKFFLKHSDPCTKEWHKEMSLSIRNNAIRKLFQSLEPNKRAEAVEIEKEIFLTANSRLNYNLLLKRRVSKIRFECLMKKYKENTKKNTLNMMSVGHWPPIAGPPSMFNSLTPYQTFGLDSFP